MTEVSLSRFSSTVLGGSILAPLLLGVAGFLLVALFNLDFDLLRSAAAQKTMLVVFGYGSSVVVVYLLPRWRRRRRIVAWSYSLLVNALVCSLLTRWMGQTKFLLFLAPEVVMMIIALAGLAMALRNRTPGLDGRD